MNNKNIITVLIFLAALIVLGYLFYNILIYILVAIILASVGSPIMKILKKIKVKKWGIPTSLAAAFTLVLLMGLIVGGFYLIIPMIISEIKLVSSIDPAQYTSVLENWLFYADNFLTKNGLLEKNQHLSDILLTQIKSLLDSISITNVVGNLFSFVGAVFILLFSVLFFSYYALKDKEIFFKMIRAAIPNSFRENYDHILSETRSQIVRYFSGVLIDMLSVGAIIGTLCYLFGVPNALLIGVLAGCLNIIPYVGPIIALCLGVIISITSLLPTDPSAAVLSMLIWKLVFIFLATKTLDDFVFQPFIYGKSVKVHPVEIFIVILFAGHIGGVTGMIFAVPAYSLLRIIVKEFFGNYYFSENNELNQNK